MEDKLTAKRSGRCCGDSDLSDREILPSKNIGPGGMMRLPHKYTVRDWDKRYE